MTPSTTSPVHQKTHGATTGASFGSAPFRTQVCLPHGDISPRNLPRQAVALFLASGFSFAVIGLSYLAYSRLLDPADFGLISTGLFFSAIATAIFEGSLKNILIRTPEPLGNPDKVALFLAMGILAGAATIILAMGGFLCWIMTLGMSAADLRFLLAFSSIYLLTFPFLVLPSAAMERRFEFHRLSLIESLGTGLERGLPLVFFVFFSSNVSRAFLWGALIGRLVRLLALNYLEPPIWAPPTRDAWENTRTRLWEASTLMGAYLASLVRDNLHVIFVGSSFGKAWIGYYSWGLQLCLLTSQVFAQISARISLPFFSQTPNEIATWDHVTHQIRLLCGLTAPLAIGALIVLPICNEIFFLGKWTPTLRLLPLLFLRMAGGLATTSLGMFLLARREVLRYVRANITWTVVEIFGAGVGLMLVGPMGLAWSYALMVWVGLWLQMASLEDRPGSRFIQMVKAIFGCRSLFVCLIGLAFLHSCLSLDQKAKIVYAFMVMGTAYLADPTLRKKGLARAWSANDSLNGF